MKNIYGGYDPDSDAEGTTIPNPTVPVESKKLIKIIIKIKIKFLLKLLLKITIKITMKINIFC